jgi:hypothetical protein
LETKGRFAPGPPSMINEKSSLGDEWITLMSFYWLWFDDYSKIGNTGNIGYTVESR